MIFAESLSCIIKWINYIRGYIDKGKFFVNLACLYGFVRSYSRRGGDGVKGVTFFQLAASITLSEYMKIWFNIPVIIYPLL